MTIKIVFQSFEGFVPTSYINKIMWLADTVIHD